MAGPTSDHDNSITKMIIDEAGSLGMAVPTSNHDNR